MTTVESVFFVIGVICLGLGSSLIAVSFIAYFVDKRKANL